MESVLAAQWAITKSGNEAHLVRQARDGNPDAISQLYHQYAPAIYRYFYFRTRNHHIAEDLTGELFLQVVEALPGYEERGRPFPAWLFRIARYRLIDYYRHARAVQVESLPTALADAKQELSETVVTRRQAHQRLHERISDLNDEQKMVVQLRFFEGYSLDDTAAVLGKTTAAIKGLQRRALQHLAQGGDGLAA
jgi:RNA polymerase sigma-70 factor (ECF subfamily)